MASSVLVPAAAGRPAIFQGRYGSRGNLELVTPSPDGGLVCCWFNSDPVGGPVTEPAIPAGTWSAGLRFAEPTTYLAVAGMQTRRGPDWLEVVATHAGGLHRWTWSPGAGFELTDEITGVTGTPYVVETDAGIEVGTRPDEGPLPPEIAVAWCESTMGDERHLEVVLRVGERLTHDRIRR